RGPCSPRQSGDLRCGPGGVLRARLASPPLGASGRGRTRLHVAPGGLPVRDEEVDRAGGRGPFVVNGVGGRVWTSRAVVAGRPRTADRARGGGVFGGRGGGGGVGAGGAVAACRPRMDAGGWGGRADDIDACGDLPADR